MLVDVCSDLHIDQWWHTTQLFDPIGPKKVCDDGSPLYIDWQWYQQQQNDKATVLVVAGDLSNVIETTLLTLRHAAKVYEHVIFVDGNHEHYNRTSYNQNMNVLENASAEYPNIVFLSPNRPTFILDDVAFIGSNAWYDWRCYEHKGLTQEDAKDVWKKTLNDFPMIVFDDGFPDKLSDTQVPILTEAVAALQDTSAVWNIVMVTHTTPLVELAEWKNDRLWNQMTPSFVNSQLQQVLAVDTEQKISHWIYGHTHVRKTSTINNVTFVNNCRGYPRELWNWTLQQIEV